MIMSFGPSQLTADVIVSVIVSIAWLVCLLAVYATRLFSRRFNTPSAAALLYTIEIMGAGMISFFILRPSVIFHLHSALHIGSVSVFLLLVVVVTVIVAQIFRLVRD